LERSIDPVRVRRVGARMTKGLALRFGRMGRALRDSFGGLAVLALLLVERDFFDPAFYRERYRKGRFQQWFPRLHFAFSGARQRRKPNSWFSQQKYELRLSHRDIRPPVLHYLLTPRVKRRPSGPAPAQQPAGIDPSAPSLPAVAAPQSPPPPPGDRLTVLWPLIRSDLAGLQDVTSQLSPTVDLEAKLKAVRIDPVPPKIGSVVRSILNALPREVDHLLVLPWLAVTGGSERVTSHLLRLLREHYASGGLCIFCPDTLADLKPEDRSHFDIPVVAINDFAPKLDQMARIEVFDRVLIELRPATVHSVNSLTAWLAFVDRGHFYAKDSKLFGNIYSDIRILDGKPVGYFWQTLPYTIGNLAGVIADNRMVLERANENFGFSSEYRARCHVVSTPVVGLANADPRTEMRPYRPSGTKHSLWMSRIAIEKRLEVLRDLAALCPDRRFSIYGATLSMALPVDLSWVESTSNVTLQGRFGQLADLPIDQFDSYIFTTMAEGMPISLLEVTMLGLPVVAPAIGGIGEFIDHETGWLVSANADASEYAAALDEIHRDPEEAQRRVARAQERLLERHSWKTYQSRMRAIPGYLNARRG
jgi:glycosyltransferase involved in cell wall biosynthesis